MKKLLWMSALLAVSAISGAQNIQSDVIATGGGSASVNSSNGTYLVSFTIGESVIGTFKPQNFIIVRGFQQGYNLKDYYHTPTYAWAANNSSVTATAVSTTNASNTVEETVNTTYVVMVPAACETEGSWRYTSGNFNSVLFSVQEKTVSVAALGHEYDYSNGVVTTPATCTSKGVMTYTCTRNSSHTTTQEIAIDANAHDWGEWDITPATEQAEGSMTRTCRHNSAHKETITIPKLNHEHHLSHVAAIAATCTEAGQKEYWLCSGCGNKYASDGTNPDLIADIVVPALGHSWNNGSVTTDPTCTETGVKTFSCTRTGCTQTRTEAVAELGHDWNETAVVTVNATCTTDGVKTHYCKRTGCDGFYNETWLAFGHDYPADGDTTRYATCTIDGEITFTCTRDRTHTYTEAIPAIGHAWDEGLETPATCTDSAYMTYTCLNDPAHKKIEKTDPPLGHDWSDSTITVVPTCTTSGRMVVTCSRNASHKQTLTIPALGHDFVDEALIAAATCSAPGSMLQVCLNDTVHKRTVDVAIDTAAHMWGDWVEIDGGKERRVCEHNAAHTQTRDVLPADHVHQPSLVEGVAATCLHSGTINYYHCQSCERDYVDEACTNEVRSYIAPALGHSWADGEVLLAATCEAAGRVRQVCQNDESHVREIMIAALGHRWDDGTEVIAATCETEGEMLYTCLNDVTHTNREAIEPLGHIYDTTRVEATCEVAGSETITCRRDASHTSTTVIPAIGHDWSEWDTTTYATAVSPGIEKRVCRNDGTHVETRTYEVAGENGTTPMQGWTSYIGTNGDVTVDEQQEGTCLHITIGSENGEPGSAEFVSPVLSGLEGQYYDPDNLVPITITFEAMFVASGDDTTTTISVLTGAGLENQIGNLQIIDSNGKPVDFGSVTVGSQWDTYTLTGYIGPEGRDSISLQFLTGTTLGDLLVGNIDVQINGKEVASFFENTRESGGQGGEQGGEQGGQGGEQGGQGGEQGGQGGEQGGDPNAIDENVVASEIRVYPNPTTAKLYVELPADNASGVVKCFDNTGRMIMEKEFESTGKVELDVSSLPQGSYTLKIVIDETVTTKQVLKY